MRPAAAQRTGRTAWASSRRAWGESQLDTNDVPLFPAGSYPDASAKELTLSSEWLTWGFCGDDYFPLVYGHRRDLAAARMCTERL